MAIKFDHVDGSPSAGFAVGFRHIIVIVVVKSLLIRGRWHRCQLDRELSGGVGGSWCGAKWKQRAVGQRRILKLIAGTRKGAEAWPPFGLVGDADKTINRVGLRGAIKFRLPQISSKKISKPIRGARV